MKDPQGANQQAFWQAFAGNAHNNDQAKHADCEIFARAKFDRQFRQKRCDKGQADNADQAANDRPRQREAQRLTTAPGLEHLVAILNRGRSRPPVERA